MWITGNPVQRLVLVFDYVFPLEAKEICPPEAHCLSFILCSQPTPVFLPGKSHGRRSMVGYSPWGHKELDTTATSLSLSWKMSSSKARPGYAHFYLLGLRQ